MSICFISLQKKRELRLDPEEQKGVILPDCWWGHIDEGLCLLCFRIVPVISYN